MSTKCSQLFLPQLGNRSSLNPSCFKEKQRPESDFPGAKVAGIPKSPIRVSAKIRKKRRRPRLFFLPGTGKSLVLPEFPSEGLQTLSCKFWSAERPLRALSIRQSHQYFSGNFGDFSRKAIPLSGGVGPSGASLPGNFSPDENIVEKGKHAGAEAPPAPLCKGSCQRS